MKKKTVVLLLLSICALTLLSQESSLLQEAPTQVEIQALLARSNAKLAALRRKHTDHKEDSHTSDAVIRVEARGIRELETLRLMVAQGTQTPTTISVLWGLTH